MNKATGLDWQIEYNYLKKYAIMNNMRNLIIALELAVKYHQGQYRDSGEPYIIHPLMVCKTLILLSVETYLNKWYPEKSNQWIKHQLDVLYATAVLHDVIEDCDLPNKGIEFVVVYHLDREVWINVNILSKELGRLNIDSIFIEQDGKLDKVFYKDEQLHELRSCSKVLVAMAIGIAIEDKMLVNGIPLSLDTKIFPSIKNLVKIKNKDNLLKIQTWTIKNLLTHTTGYESQMMSERYIEDIDKNELLDYALNYDIPFDVGTRFAYNNLEPFVLSVFFQESFGINLKDYINEKIFKKLNIKEFEWDNYGKYCPAATGLYLKHSDFHKIGLLLLNNGRYDGKQIIPGNWIVEMTSMQLETPSTYKPERVFPKIGVGYYTFISRDNYIFRDGSNGQYIIVNKEKKLLVTTMASEKDMKKITEIFRDII